MRLLLVLFFSLLIAIDVCGQFRGDKLFERGDYLEALQLYRKQLEEMGSEKSEKADLLKIRVAYCFFHMNDMLRAEEMYKRVNPDLLGAEEMTYYAIALVHTGNYKKASEQLELAESLGADPMVLERIRNTCDFAAEVLKMKPMYAANKTKIDLKGLSSGATYYQGKSVIVAAPDMGENVIKDSRGYRTTRLYKTVFTGDGTSGRLLPFANELNDKYHIGAVTFTSDYKRIYYTRTIVKADGTSVFKLMTAEEEGGVWGHIEELNINSDDYSCVQPSLYKDSLLYFVSDMPGGIGGKDIYVAEVRGAECGDIRNLGEQINTSNDESFPFVAEDGKLFFASNGHIGLGGLDVFVSEVAANGDWNYPQNMGRPINSSMDDFSLVFRNTDCTDGYVSSNRGGGYNDFLFAIRLLKSKNSPNSTLATRGNGAMRKMQVAGYPAVQAVEEKVQAPIQNIKQYEMPKDDLFETDYQYAIQVGAFRTPVPRVYFEHLRNVKVYLGYDNIYRYAVGEYPDEKLAKTDLKQVRKAIENAFVMDVDRYLAEKKIQNDRRGDAISDDELLLRRLKILEKEGAVLNRKQKLPARARTLNKPQDNEIRSSEQAYTVVLMSADKVYNPNQFNGINNIDVLAISKGSYMYCAGLFSTLDEASVELGRVQSMGFNDSYVLRRKGGVLYSESLKSKASPVRRNIADLKDVLNF